MKQDERYNFITGGSKVGIEYDIMGYAKSISDETGIKLSRVLYVLEYFVRYNRFVLGRGDGFRFRDMEIYPDFGFLDYLEMIKDDDLMQMVQRSYMRRIYRINYGMSKVQYDEYHIQSQLLDGNVRKKKRIISQSRSMRLLRFLYKRKARKRFRI